MSNPTTHTDLSADDRRVLIQERAAKTRRARVIRGRAFFTVMTLAFLVAVLPLGSVLYTLISKGTGFISWSFFTTVPTQPSLIDQSAIGGISNAIVGTLLVIGMAAAMSIPVGVLVGLFLAERDTRPANILRSMVGVMTGLPSILFGIFSLVYIVSAMGGYSAFAGSLALAMMMLPVVARSSEESFRAVPSTLREAALALGARRSVVARSVIIPTRRRRRRYRRLRVRPLVLTDSEVILKNIIELGV